MIIEHMFASMNPANADGALRVLAGRLEGSPMDKFTHLLLAAAVLILAIEVLYLIAA